MASILISSSEKYSGKSSLCTGLGMILKGRGHSPGYMKPIGNLLVDVNGGLSDEDVEQMKKILELSVSSRDITPVLLTENLINDALCGVKKDLGTAIRDAYSRVCKDRDIVLIEGTGGIGTGAMYDLSDPQVAEILETKILLITRYDSVNAVDRILCDVALINDPQMLAGVILNEVDESEIKHVCELVVPFLEERGITVFGVIPKDTTLHSVSLTEIVEDLHAEVLTGVEHLGDLVDHYLVGAMEVNSAIKYFRRTPNCVVITGGDRADIQMAAVEARVKGLVLTGNLHPGGPVLGSAQEAGIPVILVRGDTMSTIGRMEQLIGRARFRQDRKLEKIIELINNNVDVDGIISSIDGV